MYDNFGYAQKTENTKTQDAGDTILSSGNFLPSVFTSEISKTNGKTKLQVNWGEKELGLEISIKKLEHCWINNIIGTLNAEASDKTASIFSGKGFSPNLKFGLVVITIGKKHLKHYGNNQAHLIDLTTGEKYRNPKLDVDSLKYSKMLENPIKYGVSYQHFGYLLFGIEYETSKFTLIDSSRIGDDIAKKQTFNALQLFGQAYWGRNYLKKDKQFSWVHTFRYNYGESNNIEDLDAYDFVKLENLGASSTTHNASTKKTVYLAKEYAKSHQHKAAYEWNFYPGENKNLQIGFLCGLTGKYTNESKELTTAAHLGLNFPVVINEKNDSKLFLALIGELSSPNLNANTDYAKIKDHISFSFRLGVPLGFDFITKK